MIIVRLCCIHVYRWQAPSYVLKRASVCSTVPKYCCSLSVYCGTPPKGSDVDATGLIWSMSDHTKEQGKRESKEPLTLYIYSNIFK